MIIKSQHVPKNLSSLAWLDAQIKALPVFIGLLLSALLLASCGGTSSSTSIPSLAAPGNVAVIAGDGLVIVDWDNVQGATTYNLYFSKATERVWTKVSGVVSGGTVSGLVNGLGYSFYIAATNSDGEGVASTEVLATPRLIRFTLLQNTGGNGVLPIADYDNNGTVEPFGFSNDGTGMMQSWPAGTVTFLPNGETHFAGGSLVAADFTGDGLIDVLDDEYSNFNTALLVGGLVGGAVNYQEDPNFYSLGLYGYCETAVVADFNNDGFTDAFVPCYANIATLAINPNTHSFLLINDGLGHFTEQAIPAGVALFGELIPEGAQALDINSDGWIDIYAAGSLFINNGNLTFAMANVGWGLPTIFDEGVEFLDYNNDGLLDLALWAPYDGGLRLFKNLGSSFEDVSAQLPTLQPRAYTWGLTVIDANADGWLDIIIPGDDVLPNELLINNQGHFTKTQAGFESGSAGVRFAGGRVADFDKDGLLDLYTGNGRIYINNSPPESTCGLTVRLTDSTGRLNQHGRVITLQSVLDPGNVITRVVNGGSGYCAQNEYDVSISTPSCGMYNVQLQNQNSVAVDTTPHPFLIVN